MSKSKGEVTSGEIKNFKHLWKIIFPMSQLVVNSEKAWKPESSKSIKLIGAFGIAFLSDIILNYATIKTVTSQPFDMSDLLILIPRFSLTAIAFLTKPKADT